MEKHDRIADPWGDRTPYAPGDTWAARYMTDAGCGGRGITITRVHQHRATGTIPG